MTADLPRPASPDEPTGTPGPTPPASVAGGPLTALVDDLRALIGLVVTAEAPPPVLERADAALRAVAAELAPFTGHRRPHLFEGAATLAEAMPFDLVVGPCNPLAVPLAVAVAPPGVVATGTFPVAYQGAPGCVHGGAIAAAFDIALAAANAQSGPSGPTVDLQVRFLRPTAVGVPVRIEAQVDERTARRVVSRARLLQGGQAMATATGRFAVLTPDQIRTLAARRARPT